MSEFFDYDPLTGVRTLFDYDEDSGVVTLTDEQDMDPFLEYAKAIRDNPEISKRGIKEDWWAYAIIPPVVQMEMLNKGINIMSPDPDELKRAFREINENYPYLKLTEGKHQ